MGVEGKWERVESSYFCLEKMLYHPGGRFGPVNLISDGCGVCLDSNYTKLGVRKKSKNVMRHIFINYLMEARFQVE